MEHPTRHSRPQSRAAPRMTYFYRRYRCSCGGEDCGSRHKDVFRRFETHAAAPDRVTIERRPYHRVGTPAFDGMTHSEKKTEHQKSKEKAQYVSWLNSPSVEAKMRSGEYAMVDRSSLGSGSKGGEVAKKAFRLRR